MEAAGSREVDVRPEEAPPARNREARHRRPTPGRQFRAVLHKNLLLQARGGRSLCGLGGGAALALEVLTPALFFLVMCLPKYYLPVSPTRLPAQLFPAVDLDLQAWARTYAGPARATGEARLLFAPNTSADATALMRSAAAAVACPADAARKRPGARSFHALFRGSGGAQCEQQGACLGTPACWEGLLGRQIVGHPSEAEALAAAAAEPETVDAVVVFGDGGAAAPGARYTIRANHTGLPSTRVVYNAFDILPDSQYRDYWFFANLQLALDQAILGRALGSDGRPALVDIQVKPFPWPATSFDAGAVLAAAAFNLLLVFAFLAPTRAAVAAIVREKELRLREGMRIFGLQDGAYWASWALTHYGTLFLSCALCAAIGTYPFPHTPPLVMAVLLWLAAAALLAFAYFLSTLFSKSRVAGLATAMLYALAMVPGYLMPTVEPYGGRGWVAACLAPPSALSLFATVLLKFEGAQRGVTWRALGQAVTPQYPFSAATILRMLALDVALYSLLAWYLDKVLPGDVGQRLPPRSDEGGAAVAVAVRGLRRDFATTDGGVKRALDGLTLDVRADQVTALLGHNGAGKTTAISILTGVLPPTAGDARISGASILTDMPAIRRSLGVCPQFDVLWPDITVAEHLRLYAAIKGYSGRDAGAVADEAAWDVGLGEKLGTRAGELSGGQRRKLSVALAFMGDPAVVFLDEPTSGMDPYSRRFTWEVIRRQRPGRAVVLTTHSMEEADMLADRIAILAAGRLAAEGSGLDLKARFGAGAGALVRRHVPDAALVSISAAELAYRLPRERAGAFPALLRELEAAKADLGLSGFGLSVTTLEEQWRALWVKRALSARRDQLALLTQLAVPVGLVLLALWTRKATSAYPQEPALALSREACLQGRPAALGASAAARANATGLAALTAGYPHGALADTGTQALWAFGAPVAGTLDGWLLDHWYGGPGTDDALFVRSLSDTPQVLGAGGRVALTLAFNTSAIHALPAALSAATGALLRAATGDASASIAAANHPLPTLPTEPAVVIEKEFSDLLLVLCLTMAGAVLGASFAVFLVRERSGGSKAGQLVAGAPPTAFWGATLAWDLAAFSVPAAGIILCFCCFDLPQFRGARLATTIALLWAFGCAALPLTYWASFAFQDEMAALQRINTVAFLVGFLGFLSSYILDFVARLKPGAKQASRVVKLALRAVSPHFALARGTYEASMSGSGSVDPDAEAGGAGADDVDVAAERAALRGGDVGGCQVLAEGLERRYDQGALARPLRAVADLWLGVRAGECFGLLGVNGAGKTSTFRMLTGELAPSAGDAMVAGHSVVRALAAARQQLGYCPQANALPGALTGREVLWMYARLRGVPPARLGAAVERLLRRLDLAEYADRACESYSGGNKRKLAVAVALVGEPAVVLLDEPSTGMDPGARHALWRIIRREVASAGRTVVLTSHSMEECEALCSRIGILAAGRLRCLGSVQHLKNRFGAGYVVDFKLAPGADAGAAAAWMHGQCPEARLRMREPGRLAFAVPQAALDLAALFGAVEAARHGLGIDEYAISQTTLEHVFVALAAGARQGGHAEDHIRDPSSSGCLQTFQGGDKGLAPVYGRCARKRDNSVHPLDGSLARSGSHAVSFVSTQALAYSAPERETDYNTSWIVLWDGDSPTDDACAEAEAIGAGRFDGLCTARFKRVLNGFAVTFARRELLAFLHAFRGHVHSVHEDTAVSVHGYVEQPAPWALDRIDQLTLPLDGAYHYSGLGSGVNVYVVDTGILTSHQEFRFADGSLGSRAREVFTSLQSGSPGDDCNGHGTHVAASVGGLVHGVAKNASLLAVRALECLGNGTVSQVIQGLDWVREHCEAPAVVVMALGGEAQYALDLAVHDLARAGVAVLVAAGNEDTDACTKSPAREKLAITVAATTRTDARLWISPGAASNYGKCVSMWAPGADIISASRAGDAATEFRSGTSQAVPFVAGAVALYLENNTNAGPEEILGALQASGAWGVVHEPSASGPFNAHDLDDTSPVLLDTDIFHAASFLPSGLVVSAPGSIGSSGGPGSFGPFVVNITLNEAPAADVHAAVSLTERMRGTVTPANLTFLASNWAQPQSLLLDVGTQLWATPSSDPFYLDIALASADAHFANRRPRVRVEDRKGDRLEYPKAVLALPFSDVGNTYFAIDDYIVNCSGKFLDNGGGKDVVYYIVPTQNITATVSLCGSHTFADAFDTKLYVLADQQGPWGAMLAPVACNDDFCGYLSQLTMAMKAGVAYQVVVDGFNGQFGPYRIDITAIERPAWAPVPPGLRVPAKLPGAPGTPFVDAANLVPSAAPHQKAYPPRAAAALPQTHPGPSMPPFLPIVPPHGGDAAAGNPNAAQPYPADGTSTASVAAASEAPSDSPAKRAAAAPNPATGCGAPCNASAERAVLCRDTRGLPAPPSACGELAAGAAGSAYHVCAGSSCPARYWAPMPWSACSARCGGGATSRTARCMGAHGRALGPSACAGLPAPVLSRPCNTAPCVQFVWKAGPWSNCSAACGAGQAMRRVECLSGAAGAPARDEGACGARPRPPSSAPCAGPAGAACGAQWGRAACTNHGTYDGRRCRCDANYRGLFCELPATCDGFPDSSGDCCKTVVDRDSVCCGPDSALDADGLCCERARLDACGSCGGRATAIDITGACCPGALDAGGFCCASGRLDPCGICDGDAGSCALRITARVAFNSSAWAARPAATEGAQQGPGGPAGGVRVGSGPLGSGAAGAGGMPADLPDALFVKGIAALLGVAPANLTVTPLPAQQAEERPLQLGALGLGLGLGDEDADGHQERRLKELARLELHQELHLRPHTSGLYNMRKHETPQRLQLAGVGSDPAGGGEVGVDMRRLPLVGQDADMGKGDGIESLRRRRLAVAGGTLAEAAGVPATQRGRALAAALPTPPALPANGSGGIVHVAGVALLGVLAIEGTPVCGNGVCEAGEMGVGAAAGAAPGGEHACTQDCPLAWRACPRPPAGAGDPQQPCGGRGICVPLDGACRCFRGFAGDGCTACAPGYYAFGATCLPMPSGVLAASYTAGSNDTADVASSGAGGRIANAAAQAGGADGVLGSPPPAQQTVQAGASYCVTQPKQCVAVFVSVFVGVPTRGRPALDAGNDAQTPVKKAKAGSAADGTIQAGEKLTALLQSPQENEYERARQVQIERNKERLQALQLQALAATVLPPAAPRRAAPKKSQAKRAAKLLVRAEPRRSLRQRGVASDGVSVVEELRGGAVTTNIILPKAPEKPKERHPKGEVALEDSDGGGPDAAFLAELRARAEGAAERPSVQQVAKLRCGEEDVAKVVTSGVVHLQFHPTAATPVLAAADKAGHVALWAVGRGEDGVIECTPHYSYVCGLKWAGDVLVMASYDGSVRVLDPSASPATFHLALSDEDAEFSALDVSADGATAYLGDKDGGLTVADLRAGSRAAGAAAALHDKKINTLHVEPGGRQELLSASADGSLAVWDLRRLGPKAKALAIAGHSYTCQSAYFAPDGSRRVVSTSRDDTLKIWDGAKALAQLVSIRHYNNTGRWVSPFRAVWTPASDGVIVGNMKRTVDVFDAAGVQQAALSSEFQTAISPRNVMHPRLPLLAAATASGRVHLYS
ncbi:hypothetical protein WJX81_003820 [Elliptochloris bilobata]|uniref:ATP-binding cassette transporter n=1 Tax=Elliptochloris bilobata TaxID=381761 RepID=A0AAW1S928_9CHLO